MRTKDINILVLFIAAFILSLFFVLFFQFELIGDEPNYYVLGHNLAKYSTFSLSTEGELVRSVLREPVYPGYIAAVFMLSNYSVLAVKIGQIFFILGTALIASKIAVKLYGDSFKIPVLIGTLFFPTLLNFPQYLYSESLAIFLFMLFVYCEYLLLLNKSIFLSIITGFVYAGLILCKVAMLYFIPFLIILILWFYGDKKTIITNILMLLVCFFMLLPWMVRNYGITGSYRLSYGRGINNIGNRSLKQDLSAKEIAQEFVFNFSETLGNKIFPKAMEGTKTYSYTLRLVDKYEKEVQDLEKNGMTAQQIGEKIKRDFANKVISNPFKFIILTFSELIKMTNFSYLPLLKDIPTIEFFDSIPSGKTFLAVLRLIFKTLGYIMLVFVSYFIIKDRHNIKKHALFLFLIGFTNIFYALLYAEARYAVPLIPLYVIFAWRGFLIFGKEAKLKLAA